MNGSTILGIISAAAVMYFSIFFQSANLAILLDARAILLVVGGTLAASLTIYPISSLLHLVKFFWFAVIFKSVPNRKRIVKDIVAAASVASTDQAVLMDYPFSHPFLNEGVKFLSEPSITEKDLRDILTRRSQFFKQAYSYDAKLLATIAKFPSSFGMLGSTVGLINMMSILGKSGYEGIGAAMALALVATFWGVGLTYMFFMPLADYAGRLASEDIVVRQLIIEGLLMLKRNETQMLVLEKMNGFLGLSDRILMVKKGWKLEVTEVLPTDIQAREEYIARLRKKA